MPIRSIQTILTALIAVFLLGGAIQSASTQEPLGPDAVAAIGASDIVPILFRIDYRDATSYLYGSIHAATPAAIPPPQLAREAFASTHKLVTEVRIDTLDRFEIDSAIFERATMPEGQLLTEVLNPEQGDLIYQWSVHNRMSMSWLDHFKPWFIETWVSNLSAVPAGLSVENGLDAYFSEQAVSAGMPQEGLETIDEQLDAISIGTVEEQAISLVNTLRENQTTTALVGLFLAWCDADADAIAQMITEAYSGHPFFERQYTALIVDRNLKWVEKLDLMIGAGESIFVVVGTGHLVGESSVPELLANRGYVVTRVVAEEDLE
jgi:uncharacterized protein